MKAVDVAKALIELDKAEPGFRLNDLSDVMERRFGKITWTTQMGYGEGLILCDLGYGVRGLSTGDCDAQEALFDALVKFYKLKPSEMSFLGENI